METRPSMRQDGVSRGREEPGSAGGAGMGSPDRGVGGGGAGVVLPGAQLLGWLRRQEQRRRLCQPEMSCCRGLSLSPSFGPAWPPPGVLILLSEGGKRLVCPRSPR